MGNSRLIFAAFAAFAVISFRPAHALVLQVTESEGDRYGFNNEKVELFFSVYNTYTDIREFAVGNDGAFSAGYRGDLAQSPTAYLTEAYVVRKVGGSWRTGDGRALTWMDEAANFDAFTVALLYTSRCGDCSNYDGFLETGTTDGYAGDALDPQSPFAALSEGSGVITGTTVPLPAAAWLLGAGLLALAGSSGRRGVV